MNVFTLSFFCIYLFVGLFEVQLLWSVVGARARVKPRVCQSVGT